MGGRILVVDDDATFGESLALVLRALGHATVVADSGARAMALVARERFDVALVDQRMPGLTGTEVWAQLRAMPNAPAAVLVTAAADGEALAARHGMAFLAKPFGLDELRAVLGRVLAPPRDGPG